MSKSNTPIFVLNCEVQFQILRLNLKFGLHTQVCFIDDLIQTGFTVIMNKENVKKTIILESIPECAKCVLACSIHY
jgi:hypothetical protein